MELICAIDLLGGKAVRLHKGEYDEVTVYDDDPVARAQAFVAAGARRVHVVDLEGAKVGAAAQAELVERIVRATRTHVQVGGGIRDRAVAERWFEAGADRVVLGTAAIREPALVKELCQAHPGGVIVAIDARGDDVAVDGWTRGSGRTPRELAKDAEGWGASYVLYTDVERDGTSAGPAVERTAALQDELDLVVIASGGVGSLADLRALRDAGIHEVVVGRALYDGRFELAEAMAVARGG
ncbi:MAG: 1-(5-phosphoribosyl)-5-[(5-phosphoribosylamino)methylideneamino]imidazole-4-carboxamide isomerase [Sandaracinaceae bacterium]